MKLPFPLPTDQQIHRYCFSCLQENATQVKNDNKTVYHCNACGTYNDRALYFNKHKVWVDSDKELWHESAGVFVRRQDGTFLFFQRTEFPIKLTIPAGHVDQGEQPAAAAIRELAEETGIVGTPTLIGETNVIGDACSAGADAHQWHVFLLTLHDNGDEVQLSDEGERPLWLTLDEAKNQGMAFVIERISAMYRNKLNA